MKKTEAGGSMENGYFRIWIMSAVPVMDGREANPIIMSIM